LVFDLNLTEFTGKSRVEISRHTTNLSWHRQKSCSNLWHAYT